MKLYADVLKTGVPNYMEVRRDISSQLNCAAWDEKLAGYHDAEICDYLRYGRPVTYTSPAIPKSTPINHASALRHPQHIDSFIEKEVEMEAIFGPFKTPPFTPWTKVSPLMRDKPSCAGKRVIIDLSYPPGQSVNNGVGKNCFQGKLFTYTLPTPLDLAESILAAGKGAFLWKADLQRAYRQMRIDPIDYPLLAIQHKGHTFIDLCPSFGCRQSGGSKQRVSNTVVHLMGKSGFKILAYVDDFCGVVPTYQEATASFATFEQLVGDLGLKLAVEKNTYPTRALEFLGIHFDTDTLTMTIPEDHIKQVLDEADNWMSRESAQKQEVQSLAGKLNFISTCVRPGRKFLGRILAAMRAVDSNGQVEINPQFKKDLNWFLMFAKDCNRRLLLEPRQVEFVIECDACPTGAGGFSNMHYYDLAFTPLFAQQHHISQLEAINVVQAIKTLLPHTLTQARVVVRTDNITAMYALNTGRTKDPVLEACAREIWLKAALSELDFNIVHTPGPFLVLADALSRIRINPSLDKLALDLVTKMQLPCAKPVPVDDLLSPFL